MESRSTRVRGLVSVSDMAPILDVQGIAAGSPRHARAAPAVPLAAVRAYLALGGTAATLGVGLLVWGVREQVAITDCEIRCLGHSQLPLAALGIVLMVGGAFFAAW